MARSRQSRVNMLIPPKERSPWGMMKRQHIFPRHNLQSFASWFSARAKKGRGGGWGATWRAGHDGMSASWPW
eukprot:4714397-Pyramimonas_sp.AAC.2